jgi:hypothetical protein
LVEDVARLIDTEVSAKRGLSAMALKGGFKAIKRIRPGMIPFVVDRLLPEFAAAVHPFEGPAIASGNIQSYFRSHEQAIADALLGVTDARAARAQNRLIGRTYRSLRGQAKSHVVSALPGLARVVQKHVVSA